MVIQNNIPGLNSKRNYNKNSSKLAKSLEKLSSGYAINRAADDAAGLAVSEKMRSQICGMKQSVKNCQDGISLIQTFEGALGETVAIIHRAKSLADQMANGTYDDNVDRNAVEIEYLHLCDEVNHIAATDFNGVVMLSGKPDGAVMAAELERAVNESLNRISPASTYADVPQTASVQAAFAAPKAGGTVCGDFTVYGNSSDFSFSGGVLTILGGDVTVEGTGAPTQNTIVVAKDKSANVTLRNVNIDAYGISGCAFKIEDDSKGNVTVTIEGDNTLKSGTHHAGLQKNGNINSGILTINGSGFLNAYGGAGGAGIGGGGNSKETANIIISNGTIIANGGEAGAGIGGGFSGEGVKITISGGTVIAISKDPPLNDIYGYVIGGGAGIGGGVACRGDVTIKNKESVVIAKGGTNADNIGSGYLAEFFGDTSTVNIDNILTKEPYSGNGIVDGTIVHYTGTNPNPPNPPDPPDPPNPPTPPNPIIPDKPNIPDSPDKLIVSIPNAFGNAEAKLTYTDKLILQAGARTKDAVNFMFRYSSEVIGGLAADLNCTAAGLGMDVLTLKTQESANFAIDRLDHALNKVSMIRATFGAAQNRLEHKIDNLNNNTENLTAAESQIRDADMAREMMNFTKNQILTQASQSMLAQANSLPQQVMSLISG